MKNQKFGTIYDAFKAGESDRRDGKKSDNKFKDRDRRNAYRNGYNSTSPIN